MAYCTQEDLLGMIPAAELAELTAEAGEIPDGAVVAEAIAQADAEIDAYLGVRYQVPFEPVPVRVKALSMDLAIYHLFSRRSVIPGVRKQNYDGAVAFLKQAAAGQVAVQDARSAAPASGQEVEDFTGAQRLFTRDILGQW